MLQKAIELKQVCRSFKNLKANDNLTETIYEGEYIGLLGPNGAGKTTLVEMIEGIQKPDSGEIIIFNKNWGKDEKELRKLIGFSLQETRFIDRLSVYETLKLFCSFYGLAISEAEPLLELTGLQTKKDTYTSKLSGGQKQKLALCIALIHSPKILLLDEPTTGLDPSARRDIWNLILEQKKAGTTLILTTHYLEEAEFLCDRILIMDKGKFLARGSMQELLENHG
ncbi:MAG: ABC transporter ATP-binding protein, partial [Leptospiraceae bacterium]|nr:ABC transporter ATP-binding protein [Leptospiraceae bacterium]